MFPCIFSYNPKPPHLFTLQNLLWHITLDSACYWCCLSGTNCCRTDHELESVLEDKEGIRDLKSLYDAYGSMDVSSMYDPQMYDDEYDDTYDINNVGADDADSADELTQIRFVFAVFHL